MLLWTQLRHFFSHAACFSFELCVEITAKDLLMSDEKHHLQIWNQKVAGNIFFKPQQILEIFIRLHLQPSRTSSGKWSLTWNIPSVSFLTDTTWPGVWFQHFLFFLNFRSLYTCSVENPFIFFLIHSKVDWSLVKNHSMGPPLSWSKWSELRHWALAVCP